MSTFLWLLVVAGGPVVMAIAIVYALSMRRKLSSREEAAQIDETKRLYEKE
jgi:hypothetical protein